MADRDLAFGPPESDWCFGRRPTGGRPEGLGTDLPDPAGRAGDPAAGKGRGAAQSAGSTATRDRFPSNAIWRTENATANSPLPARTIAAPAATL